jgi:hypothetical protein
LGTATIHTIGSGDLVQTLVRHDLVDRLSRATPGRARFPVSASSAGCHREGMDRSFDDLVAEAEAASVDGWDFSWLAGRATEQRPSWGYQR